jgi:hypothetical protein
MINIKFLVRKFCQILFYNQHICPLNTYMNKGKDTDPGPGGPKTYGSYGCGIPLLRQNYVILEHSLRLYINLQVLTASSEVGKLERFLSLYACKPCMYLGITLLEAKHSRK